MCALTWMSTLTAFCEAPRLTSGVADVLCGSRQDLHNPSFRLAIFGFEPLDRGGAEIVKRCVDELRHACLLVFLLFASPAAAHAGHPAADSHKARQHHVG